MPFSSVLPKIDYKDYKEFHFNGKRLLFDINSCKVFYISPIISKLLRISKNGGRKNYSRLKDDLFSKYNVSEIKGATKALGSLVKKNPDPDKYKINPPGIGRIQLSVTSDCNLDCVYCFCSLTNFKQVVKYMDKNTARAAVDYLFENSKDLKQLEIYFYGGEPLLNFPVIEYTVKYAHAKAQVYNKKVKFLVNTNGTLLSRKIIDFLDKHFGVIGLSLDGDRNIQDTQRPYKIGCHSLSSHKKVTKYLPLLLGLFRDRLRISVIQNPNNPRTLSIYRYFKELNVMYLKLAPCLFSLSPEFCANKKNISRILAEQTHLFKEYMKDISSKNSLYISNYWGVIRGILFGYGHRRSCGVGRSVITISPEGDIFSCHRAVPEPAFKLGNLKRGIDREKQAFYLNRLCDTFVKCKGCWARNLCGGGCMWLNAYTKGRIDTPNDYHCQLQKLYATQGIQLLEALFVDKIQHIN